jgi:hypothetical protein
MFMGNRGRIHNVHRALKDRHWERKAWIICVLEFKGRQREVMAPNSYTELFFLDEATAFAAGHRPCAECRRPDANRFKRLWLEGNGRQSHGDPGTMSDMDTVLHSERLGPEGTQRRWSSRISDLPDGTMVLVDDLEAVFLLLHGHLYLWSTAGYVERRAVTSRQSVTVLTPPSVTRVLVAGYRPVVHPTVESLAPTK